MKLNTFLRFIAKEAKNFKGKDLHPVELRVVHADGTYSDIADVRCNFLTSKVELVVLSANKS